jgi:hypothetical protein
MSLAVALQPALQAQPEGAVKRPLLGLAVVLFLTAGSGPARAFPEETPGFLHSTVLNGVLVFPKTGAFRLHHLQAMYLPEPPGGTYEAGTQDPARKLWAVLATAEGVEVARLDFTVEKLKAPMWLLSYYTIAAPDGAAMNDEPKLGAGDYRLEFHLPGGVFYTFAFSVKEVGGKHLTIGDWNSWAYLFYANADPQNALVWKVWLRRQETGNREGIQTRVEVVREKGSKLVATSRPDTRQYLDDKWVRYEFDLIHPMQGTSGGAYMKAADLLAQDGKYKLKMSIDGAPYGTWSFEVAGGKLRLAGRADRETADPLTCVRGGGDAFWYQSEASVQADAGAMAAPKRTFAQKGMIPDCKPISANGVTLVPVGPVATFLEAQTTWDAAAKTLAITHNEHSLRVTLGKATAVADGKPLALGAEPVQREGQTYVPLRSMVQALGAEMTWDAAAKLATIIDGNRAGMIHVP